MDIILGACLTVINGFMEECAITRRPIVRPFRCCPCTCCHEEQYTDYESIGGSIYGVDGQQGEGEGEEGVGNTATIDDHHDAQTSSSMGRQAKLVQSRQPYGHYYPKVPPMKTKYGTT